jgi:hypothetical protein
MLKTTNAVIRSRDLKLSNNQIIKRPAWFHEYGEIHIPVNPIELLKDS